MIKAFERAGRSPKEVSYVECHATGKWYCLAFQESERTCVQVPLKAILLKQIGLDIVLARGIKKSSLAVLRGT